VRTRLTINGENKDYKSNLKNLYFFVDFLLSRALYCLLVKNVLSSLKVILLNKK